jgi:hypothetical protein
MRRGYFYPASWSDFHISKTDIHLPKALNRILARENAVCNSSVAAHGRPLFL